MSEVINNATTNNNKEETKMIKDLREKMRDIEGDTRKKMTDIQMMAYKETDKVAAESKDKQEAVKKQIQKIKNKFIKDVKSCFKGSKIIVEASEYLLTVYVNDEVVLTMSDGHTKWVLEYSLGCKICNMYIEAYGEPLERGVRTSVCEVSQGAQSAQCLKGASTSTTY